jgi:hypothetical protein
MNLGFFVPIGAKMGSLTIKSEGTWREGGRRHAEPRRRTVGAGLELQTANCGCLARFSPVEMAVSTGVTRDKPG